MVSFSYYRKFIFTLLCFCTLLVSSAFAYDWQVDTWLGTATDNPALENIFTVTTLETNLNNPESVAVDSNQNVYICDYNRIIRINSLGNVTTVAGDTTTGDVDAAGTAARFNYPRGIAFNADERYLYIADASNHKIKKFDTVTLAVSTFYTFSSFEPYDLVLDNNNNVYITGNQSKVYKLNSTATLLETYAGSDTVCTDDNPAHCDGDRLSATFTNLIRGIALDRSTNILYISDSDFIRMITVTYVYSQVGDNTDFSSPRGLSVDQEGNVYLTDTNNSRLRKILNDDEGTIVNLTDTDIGYQDGDLDNALFNHPKDIFVSPRGDIFVADGSNHRIRRIFDASHTTPTATRTPTAVRTNTPTRSPTPQNTGFVAEWISQTTGSAGGNDPLILRHGTTINLEARFKNMGSATWFRDTERSDFVAFYIYKDLFYSTPQEYNDPADSNFGRSYFANSLWGRSFDGNTEFCRAALLQQEEIQPGEIGIFEFSFTAPPDATPALHREDLSLAHGPYWMSNPYNGDPADIAHVWFPIKIIE